jgi:hypothetical protein
LGPRAKRKYWFIFGVVQAIGAMYCVAAVILQDPFVLGVSFLYLLPGSLASVALSWPGRVGVNWSLWTVGVIAVVANMLIFSVALFLLARFRTSR